MCGVNQLIIILSDGNEQPAACRCRATPVRSEIIPTRPRNMATQSSISDLADREPVTPSDEPTVNSAELASKSND